MDVLDTHEDPTTSSLELGSFPGTGDAGDPTGDLHAVEVPASDEVGIA